MIYDFWLTRWFTTSHSPDDLRLLTHQMIYDFSFTRWFMTSHSPFISWNFSYDILFKNVLTTCNKGGLIISHQFLNNIIIINKNISYHPSGIGDLSRFLAILCSSLVSLLPNTFKLFGFPIFRFWTYLMRLFQRRVARSKFDIYVFILSIQ